jgi:hypothetical protein
LVRAVRLFKSEYLLNVDIMLELEVAGPGPPGV